MQISFGPPGHRGVSTLMAVGEDEYASPTDQAVKAGTWIAGAVAAAGAITGQRTLRGLGVGALLALLGVRAAVKKRPAAAPAPT